MRHSLHSKQMDPSSGHMLQAAAARNKNGLHRTITRSSQKRVAYPETQIAPEPMRPGVWMAAVALAHRRTPGNGRRTPHEDIRFAVAVEIADVDRPVRARRPSTPACRTLTPLDRLTVQVCRIAPHEDVGLAVAVEVADVIGPSEPQAPPAPASSNPLAGGQVNGPCLSRRAT